MPTQTLYNDASTEEIRQACAKIRAGLMDFDDEEALTLILALCDGLDANAEGQPRFTKLAAGAGSANSCYIASDDGRLWRICENCIREIKPLEANDVDS